MANVPFVIKLVCQGTAEQPHRPRTVAQFAHSDDGWARAHDRVKQDVIMTNDEGELGLAHRIECTFPGCTRADARYAPGARLYPTLDYALTKGEQTVTLR